MPGQYPLPSSDPARLGFAPGPLEQLDRLVRPHIEEGRHRGAQIARARHGKPARCRGDGHARPEATRVRTTSLPRRHRKETTR